MKIIFFNLLIAISINCHLNNRDMKKLLINSNYDSIPINVYCDFNEIYVIRKWKDDSFLKFDSLNNYSIFIDKANLNEYSTKLFREKIVTIIPTENKNISISVKLTGAVYKIDKEFDLFFPTRLLNSNLTAEIKIQNGLKIENYSYSNGIKNEQISLGSPFTSFSGGFLFLRMTNLNLASSAIGSAFTLGPLIYLYEKNENIEFLIEKDLESLGNFIRDTLSKNYSNLN